jgi:hypothetical protein
MKSDGIPSATGALEEAKELIAELRAACALKRQLVADRRRLIAQYKLHVADMRRLSLTIGNEEDRRSPGDRRLVNPKAQILRF